MFDRFDDRSRRLLGHARRAAQRFQHDSIGTGHILLGLLADEACMGVRVLASLGVDVAKVRGEVERRMKPGTTPVGEGQLPFTPAAKDVLEATLREAEGLGHKHIGSEHLLLGLLHDDGIAGHALRSLSLNVDDARREVARIVPPSESQRPDPRLTAAARALADRMGFASRLPGTLYSVKVQSALAAAMRDAVAVSRATTPLDLLRGVVECVAPEVAVLAPLAREVEEASKACERGEAERGRWAPASHAAIGAAHALAASRGAERVGISDLFAALVADPSSPVAKVLEAAGMPLQEVRLWVDALREPDAEPRKPGG